MSCNRINFRNLGKPNNNLAVKLSPIAMPLSQYRRFGIAVITAGLVITAAAPSFAIAVESVANPRRTASWVSDVAGILSPQTENALNTRIDRLETATSAEIMIVTIPDVKGSKATPKEFAHRLFNQWRIGKARKNNGVLLLISKGDRRVEIEVGRGLTATLTSEKVNQILAKHVTPAFKQGNYDQGAISGTDTVIQMIKSAANPITAFQTWLTTTMREEAIVILLYYGLVGTVLLCIVIDSLIRFFNWWRGFCNWVRSLFGRPPLPFTRWRTFSNGRNNDDDSIRRRSRSRSNDHSNRSSNSDSSSDSGGGSSDSNSGGGSDW
jgi:uncharacterized membrane protein YgcG